MLAQAPIVAYVPQYPPFIIASLRNAGKLLTESECAFRYLISIGDIGDAKPKGYARAVCRLRLEFSDVTPAFSKSPLVKIITGHDAVMVTSEDVRKLIVFSKRVDAPVLIHCFAGISRSSAAACIFLATKLPRGSEDEIMKIVRQYRPNINPNWYMLQLADDALGTNLLKAYRRAF